MLIGGLLGRGEGVVEDAGEAVEVPLPDRAVLDDPLLERAHGAGLGPARPDAADLLRAHEAAALQHVEVLHHGGQRHLQRCRELAHRRRAARQAHLAWNQPRSWLTSAHP
jgi:hypothetical protein